MSKHLGKGKNRRGEVKRKEMQCTGSGWGRLGRKGEKAATDSHCAKRLCKANFRDWKAAVLEIGRS